MEGPTQKCDEHENESTNVLIKLTTALRPLTVASVGDEAEKITTNNGGNGHHDSKNSIARTK